MSLNINCKMDIDLNNNEKVEIVKSCSKHNDVAELTLETLSMECLLMIFDRLDCFTLMDLCEVNEHFRTNVCTYKHVLSSKMFAIDEFIDLQPIFEDFGKFIRKLDVNEYNILGIKFSSKFNRLLSHIVGHLEPGNLTELTLRFGVVKIDKDLLNHSMQFFCNLTHFAFSACGSDEYSHAQEYVLNEIIGHARKLTSLDIRFVRTAGKWFCFKHLQNLQHLTFLFVELITFSNYRQFIQERPLLKSLIISTDSVHHQHICNLVTRYIPNLEEFEIRNSYLQLPHADDFDFSPQSKNYKSEEHYSDDSESDNFDDEDDDYDDDYVVDDEDDDDDSDEVNEDGDTTLEDSGDEDDFDFEESDSDIDDVRDPDFNLNTDHITNWKGIYIGLNGMNFLKRTWLKSHFVNCIDLYDILKMMAKKNSIEHLTIQVSTLEHDFTINNDFLTEPFPSNFTRLTTLRLISPSKDTQPFIRHFIQSLPNMTKCILDMEKINRDVQDTIINLIEASNNLEILALKVPAMNFDHLLYMKLLGIQYAKSKRSANIKPISIYINSVSQRIKCLKELKKHYDEKSIAIKIKSFMTWENDPL